MGSTPRQLGQALTVQCQSHRKADQGSLEDSPASFQCPFFLTPCSFSLLTKSILFLFPCCQPLSPSCSQSALTDWLTHLLSLRHQARPGATKVHRLWSEVIKLNRRVEIECDGRISISQRCLHLRRDDTFSQGINLEVEISDSKHRTSKGGLLPDAP